MVGVEKRCPQPNDLEINRCVKPHHFGNAVRYDLHHFADTVHACNCDSSKMLVIFTCRVVPLKRVTVPRLELTAAVVAINISKFLTKQLKLEKRGILLLDEQQSSLRLYCQAIPCFCSEPYRANSVLFNAFTVEAYRRRNQTS